MDNNPTQPVQPVANNMPNPQTANPNMMAPQPVTPAPEGKNNKTILLSLIGLVVIILVVGGIYLYFSNQQKVPQSKIPAEPPKAADATQSLENDLDSVSVDDLDKEFSTVDQDLQSL